MKYLHAFQLFFLALAPCLILIVLLWWAIAQRLKRSLPFKVQNRHAFIILTINAGCLISLLAFGLLWPSQILFVLFIIGSVASVIENPKTSLTWVVFGYCLFSLCISLF